MRILRRRKKAKSACGHRPTTVPVAVPLPTHSASWFALESRIMFDGAGIATLSTVATEPLAQSQAEALSSPEDVTVGDASPDPAPTGEPRFSSSDQALFDALAAYDTSVARQEIVFLSPNVRDYQQLLDGISPNVEVFVLDPARDGVEQMAEVLAGRTGIDAIHLISHGADGEIALGSGGLDLDWVLANTAAVQGWGQALTADGDLLIYGCNVAAGGEGQTLIDTLSRLTGADVAASDDLTGSAALDGDWDLEYQVGTIETAIVFGAELQQSWDHVLSITQDVPGAQSTNEDTNLIFSSGNSNQISISDIDAGSNPIEVTVSVTNGALSLSGTTGLTFTSGDGTADTTMTFRGTVTDINTALNGLTYIPTAEYNGGATLTITSVDNTLVSLNIDANLQARYTFEGNANDVAPGTAQNGTLTNGASIVTDGTRGQVLSLDGVNDFVDLSTHTADFTAFTQGTISGWIKATGTFETIFSISDTADTGSYAALFLGASGYLTYEVMENGVMQLAVFKSDIAINDGNWHHVAVTVGPSGNSLYVDGALATGGQLTYDTGNTATQRFFSSVSGLDSMAIGRNQDSSGGKWYTTGGLDDVRLYDRVLTSSEVAALASDLALTDVDAVAITVAAVNDPPVNSVPGAQVVNEDTTLVFSSGNGNLISIGDVDAGGSPVEVTLTGTNGRVTLSGTAGLTFTVGDGSADATMTFTGAVANINTALAGLSFSPTPNFTGAANLQIVTNDQGNTGWGGALSDTDNVSITVNAVNDAPIVLNQGLLFDGVDDKVVVAPSASLTVTTTVTMEAWVQRQGTPAGTQIILNKEGEYELGISSTGNIQWALANTTPGWNWVNTGYTLPANQWTHIAVSYNAGVVNTYVNGLLVDSYNGSGSIGDVYPVLNELTIGGRQNASTQRFEGLIDEVRVWNVARTGVEISTNYDQTLTGGEAGLVGYWRFAEATGTTALDLTANSNHGLLGNGVPTEEPTRQFTYTILEDGSLSVSASGILANATDAEGSPLTAVLVTGPANAASFTLNPDGSFSYTPVANYFGSDSFVFRASDGSLLSQSATVALTVTPVNDAPVNTVPGAQTVNEDTPLVFSSGNGNLISIADVDAGGSPVEGTLTGTNGTITLSGTTGLTFSVGDGTADATMTFTGTVADINTALAGLSFTPTSNFTGAASLQIVTNDQGNTGSGGAQSDSDTVAITVTPVNDAPVVATNAGSTVARGGTDTITSAELQVTDVDNSPAQLNYTVTVVPVNGQLELTTVPGVAITSFTQAQIDAGQVVYVHDGSFTASDSFTFTVSDGAGGNIGATTFGITVTPVNSAPTLAANDGSTVVQGLTDVITASELQVIDADNSPGQLLYTVTSAPASGQLELTTAPGVALTTFTQADIDAGRVVFVHSGAAVTSDGFTFTVSDGAGGTIGATTFTFTVAPFIPPPGGGGGSGGSGGGGGGTGGSGGTGSGSGSGSGGSGGIVPPPIQPPPVLIGVGVPVKEMSVVGATNDPLPRTMTPNRTFARVEQPTVGIQEPPARPVEPFSLPVKKVLAVGHKLVEQLTKLADDLERGVQEREHKTQLIGQVASFSGMALSAGFVAWILRGGALVASFLVSMPAWRHFDPLPVLGGELLTRRKRDRKIREEDEQEKKQFRGLDRVLKTSRNESNGKRKGR